ncbi:MAG: dTDP-4-dehydrorhamnose reductase [Rhodobacteraceae bacterium]|nr:dTDP-4-dehydrorhamnose reductase [Paracoccaceae bacterium]
MSLLVFGKTGQVARELAIRAPDAVFLDRSEADLRDPAGCALAIATRKASVVINAAAYTAVDKAESEEALATVINGEAPRAMAEACAALDIPFVHISTDYVFDGSGSDPWRTGDETGPLGAYGRSKLVGEKGIQMVGGKSVVLRTSWVFSSHGANFVKTMLRLGADRDALNIVDDQIGGPTSAADIAEACLTIAKDLQEGSAPGVYHYSGTPDVSWSNFAREIFSQTGLPCSVNGIPSSEYPTPAPRPKNSRLDNAATKADFGLDRPDWRTALSDILKELKT